MFCTKCGGSNSEGSAYCVHCGAPLSPAAPKEKARLITWLIVGIVALLGAAAAVYFLTLGTSVKGLWYSDKYKEVLEFLDGGKVAVHTLMAAATEDYDYNMQTGDGVIKVAQEDYHFSVGKDTLTLEIATVKAEFKKASNGFDIDDYLTGFLEGVYSNQKNAEVVELKQDMTAVVHNVSGDITGRYDYDFENGSGTITLGGKAEEFTANGICIVHGSYGYYKKEKDGFDIDGFVAKCGNALTGDWYDIQGRHGQLTFAADGTLQFLSYGKTFTGTYTYDSSAGSGAITVNGLQGDFTLSGNALTVKGDVITLSGDTVTTGGVMLMKEYKEQEDNAFVYIEGTWYDGAGLRGTITFNQDGTVEYTENGTVQAGTASYNPFTLTGTITIAATGETIAFNHMNGRICADNSEYFWSSVEQHPGSIVSTWYDKAGHLGTLTFRKDGTAVFCNKPDGSNYSGTYTFDAAQGTGSFTVDVNGVNKTYSISVSNGLISLNNGEAYFTTIFTSQIN